MQPEIPQSSATVRPLVVPEIVTAPGEIDIANAQQFGAGLFRAIATGAAVVIADLTRTVFCDSTGASFLLAATKRAHASGSQLRIATGDDSVLRVLTLLGFDKLLDIYPSMHEALKNRALPTADEADDTGGSGGEERPAQGGSAPDGRLH